jgi:hypothetical protein
LLFTPIPDLKYTGTSKLVQYVKEQGWSIGALGVASWTGYKMIIDELYANLSVANQEVHRITYQASVDLLDSLYASMNGQAYDDLLGLTSGLKSSDGFNQFLKAMSTFAINDDLLKSLRFSIDYWWMYGKREFYKKNRLSSKRNKVLMKEAIEKVNFDFSDDKLFLKMWRDHLTNGVTPNGFYGVGNTLMSLAEYHGHHSLNIGILGRYTMEGPMLKDALEQLGQVPPIHQPFVALGEKDNWVLIDLRPFTETFFWGNYIQTLDMQKMMRGYDMIIIPKTNSKAEVNY